MGAETHAWPALGPQPLVTVVTPSFNQGEFIAATVESVLAQDYPALEYFVMDAGSTDGTLDILRSYGERIRWVSAPDNGQADAINQGWRRGAGAIVAWLNADDLYQPGAVRAAIEQLRAHPHASGVYGDCAYIDERGEPIGAHPSAPFDYLRLVRTGMTPIAQPATFLRRAAVEQAGGVDERLHMVLDLDLWLRLGRLGPLVYVPETWAAFREHAGSKTIARQARAAPEVLATFERFFADPTLPPEIRALQAEALSSAQVFAGNALMMGGQLAAARRYALRGLPGAAPRIQLMALKVLLVSTLGRAGLAAYLWGRRGARAALRSAMPRG